MSEAPPLKNIQLADVFEFHDQLLKMHAAGVPLALRLRGAQESLPSELERIGVKLALLVGRGESVEQTLLSDDDIPELYHNALIAWFHAGKAPEVFTTLNRAGMWRKELEGQFKYSMQQPLVLLILVYLGFVGLVIFIWPKLDSLWRQIGTTPGIAYTSISQLHAWFPIWGPAVPCLIAVDLFLRYRNKAFDRSRSFQVRERNVETIRKSMYAESLSQLIGHGVNTDHAVGLLRGTLLPHANRVGHIAHWAIADNMHTEQQQRALEFVSQIYSDAANDASRHWQNGWFTIYASILGGLMVLAFGLSVFGPLIELLSTLVHP